MTRTTQWTIGNNTYTGTTDDRDRMYAEAGVLRQTCETCHGEGKTRVQAPPPKVKLSARLKVLTGWLRVLWSGIASGWVAFPLALVLGSVMGTFFIRGMAAVSGMQAIDPEIVMALSCLLGIISAFGVLIKRC